MKLRALPIPRPMVWAVEAYERLGGERRVSAQPDQTDQTGSIKGPFEAEHIQHLPSTAISGWTPLSSAFNSEYHGGSPPCVAAAKINIPNIAVINLTLTTA